MKRRAFGRVVAAALVAPALPARPQAMAPYRVAWVSTDRKDAPTPNLDAFRGGMRDLGYAEGRNVALDTWWGEGSSARVEKLVPEIARARPDLFVAAGGGALGALIRAGIRQPIVFSVSADPVEAKFVASFAHPGGNMTGISLFTLALVGKRLELLKEIVPGAKRVALIANPQHPGERKEFSAAWDAAARLGLTLRYFPVASAPELEAALTDIARGRDDAVVAFADGFTLGFAGRLAAFSREHRIPTVDGWAPFARLGNLMTYGPVIEDVYRRLAAYVDRIRRGALPADLPVELPTKVELVVNVATARALGLTLPPSILQRADEVIT